MVVFGKNRAIFTFVLLSLFFSMSVPNVVALVEEKSISDLTKDSDNIITGEVSSRESYWKDGNIFTNVVISVDQRIKGNSDNQFIVKVPGGTVGNIYAEVSDVPLFDDNEKVLLFLKGESVNGWNQGKYSILDNRIKETGEPLVEFVHNIEQNLKTQVDDQNIDNRIYSDTTYAETGVTLITAAMATTSHITNITPNSGRAIAEELGSTVAASDSTEVTIDGFAFGSTKGSVKFWYVGTILSDATIISWTDTKIVAKVPGRISSNTKPGGNGNVQVFTSDGIHSDNYGNFGVTYSYGGGKWPGKNVTYMVNPNTEDTDNELSAIQAATDTWNNADANFGLVYGGSTSKTSVTIDGENSVIWVNYDTGSVATTTTWWFGTNTKTIVESDVVFNDLSIDWDTNNSSSKIDVQTVATHEFGHWLQLLDLYGSTDNKKMMYGYVGQGVTKRTLNTDDIAGIKWIYGLGTLPPEDAIPPTTALSGAIEGTVYNSNVTIKLTAEDNIGGSGVKNTTFTINGGQVVVYSDPLAISDEGYTTVTYMSTDNAGNIEESKKINFTISKGDTLAYYRGLGLNPSTVETSDLLKAADDWRNDIIPPGFYVSLATVQLLTLADEWRVS